MSKHEHRQIMQDGAAATGNGTPINCPGHGTFTGQVSGTFVGTITWEATLDGTNWIAIGLTNLNTANVATTTTVAGIFRVSCAGLALLRARISAYTSGAITVHGRVTPF